MNNIDKNVFRGKKISYRRGYPIIYDPTHHKASKSGMVEVHYIIAEEQIGRPLREGEEVHHIDKNRDNYSASNLMVFDSKASHSAYHAALRFGSDIQLTRLDGIWHCEVLYSKREQQGASQKLARRMYRCPLCQGAMKYKYAKMCKSCKDKKAAEKIPTKEQLVEDLVDFTSFCKIGQKYRVTDNAVRRWCKKYGLKYHSSDYKNNKE